MAEPERASNAPEMVQKTDSTDSAGAPRRKRSAASAALLDAADRRLAELAMLEPDWDSYGGDPPTARATDTVRDLLRAVCDQFVALPVDRLRPFAIAPTPDGGILIEWRSPGQRIAVLVGAEASLDYLVTQGEGDAQRYEEQENVSRKTILERIAAALHGATQA